MSFRLFYFFRFFGNFLLTDRNLYDIIKLKIDLTKKREGLLHPLRYTDGTAELESTQRVNAKIDHSFSQAVYFLMLRNVTTIDTVVTIIETMVTHNATISNIDITPFGFQPYRVQPLSTAPCTRLYYTTSV